MKIQWNPISIFAFLMATYLMSGCGEGAFYTVADFPKVSKADVHVHIRTERDAFASQAEQDNFKLVNIVVDGAGTWEGIRNQFHYVELQQKAHPDRFRTITSFSVEDFHTQGWSERSIAWLDSCFSRGAMGVKVWKNIGMVLKDTNDRNVMVDDLRLDKIFDHLQKQDKLLFAHLGEPLNCWLPLEEMTTNNDRSYFKEHPQYHMHQFPELPSHHELMSARDRLIDKNPDLRFVGAHMASLEWNVDTLGEWLAKYPKATIDLAARMGQVFYQAQQDPERVRNFFLKYQNQIMYATDLGDNGSADPADLKARLHQTWMRDWIFFATDDPMESDLINGPFTGIKLPKEAVSQIFYGTANRVFGFE